MSGFIGKLLSFLCMTMFLGSCVFEYPEEPGNEEDMVPGDRIVLQVNVKPVNVSSTNDPTERIQSVRVVIIGKGTEQTPDSIECNRLFDIPATDASDFSYVLRWNSTPGMKDIYVVANEESVDEGLTAKLNGYREKTEAGDFSQWLNSYSFSPEYVSDKDNNIYLPYSYSLENIVPEAGKVNTINAWLVPVATKFIFNFTNNRTDAVKVNGISLAYANTSNFLIGHPDALYKEYNGSQIYWVDWLAEISKNSWGHQGFVDNEEYNELVGWISYYQMPEDTRSIVYDFIPEGSAGIFEVAGATKREENGEEIVTPGQHTTPVYYIPESMNFTRLGSDINGESQNQEDSGEENEQRFYLTILLEDTGVSEAPPFKEIAIPNLKALFRNTYVIIDLNMSEGDIEVYAEIASWNEKTANGWVNEGKVPSDNPFRIRKKW